MPKSKENEGPQQRRAGLLWPYLALVVVHLLSGLAAEQPIILSDELGYLGNARYLAGVSHLPDMEGTQFYHFGYSLFLLPAFWLFSDPVSAYKAAIAINALLASSLIVPLYFMLTAIFRVSTPTARWIAFACCVYPPLIFHSSFAWSESAYVPLYAATAALFGRLLTTRRATDALVFGAVTGFLYTVHPRAVPVIAAAGGYLLVLAWLRSIPVRQLLLSTSAMALVVGPTRAMLSRLKTLGWAGSGEDLINKLAGRLVPDSDLAAMIERVSGQLLYLTQATYGLFLAGLVAAVWLIVRRAAAGSLRRTLAEPPTGVVIFTLVSAGGVFLASCASKLYSVHGPDGLRGDQFLYGRYNEAFGVMLLAFALAGWCRERPESRRLAWAIAGVVLITLCLTAVVVVEIDDALERHTAARPETPLGERIPPSDVRAPSVPGIYPLVILFGGLNLTAVSFVALACFLLVVASLRASIPLGLALLALLFLSVSVANHFLFVAPAIERARPRLDFVSQLAALAPIDELSYDFANRERSFYSGVQYLMPNTVFDRFDSRAGETPTSSAVISSHGWRDAEALGARFFLSADPEDIAFWVLPGELETRLDRFAAWGELLGPRPVAGVRATGFGRPNLNAGRLGRWTDGDATLKVVVDRRNPPLMLGIEVGSTRRDAAELRLRVNGVELWNDPIPRIGGAKTFSLESIPPADELAVEIISDTVTSSEPSEPSGEGRTLGLFVRRVRLDGRTTLADAVSGGIVLGAQQVLGFPESGFHRSESFDGAPARWTNGTARLRILLDPERLPSSVEVATAVPARDGARLRIVANGVDLGDRRIPSEDWSGSFDLAGVPMRDELQLELISDTFRPSETIDGSTDHRTLGVVVRGIRLVASDCPAGG